VITSTAIRHRENTAEKEVVAMMILSSEGFFGSLNYCRTVELSNRGFEIRPMFQTACIYMGSHQYFVEMSNRRTVESALRNIVSFSKLRKFLLNRIFRQSFWDITFFPNSRITFSGKSTSS